MNNYINTNQIDRIIRPFVEKYIDNKYPNNTLYEMPSNDELINLSNDMTKQLLIKYPEFEQALLQNIDDEVQVSYLGCGGYLLWGLLIGSIYCRCNRCRCGRNCRCRCGRNCRCGYGCRR